MQSSENISRFLIDLSLESKKDLRVISKDTSENLKTIEEEALADYVSNGLNFIQSYKDMKECCTTLDNIKEVVDSFQVNLEKICHEIQELQTQSQTMKIKLRNRQELKSELSQLIDELVVSNDIIKSIMDSDITESDFQESLHELHHKLSFLQKQNFVFEEASGGDDLHAFTHVQELLEKLKTRAIHKIKDFLMKKILSFRKPMTNYHVPQSVLLKYRFVYEFLLSHDRFTALTLKEEYVDTLSKILYAYFKEYYDKLLKLVSTDNINFKDYIFSDHHQGMDTSHQNTSSIQQSLRKSFFSSNKNLQQSGNIGNLVPSGSSNALAKKDESTSNLKSSTSETYTLGSRITLLYPGEILQPILVPHILANELNGGRIRFEKMFRSINYAILENACNEAIFLSDFFLVPSNSKQAHTLFSAIWGRVLNQLLLRRLDTQILNSGDIIGILLCLRLSHEFHDIEVLRGSTVLKPYWQACVATLYGRFSKLMTIAVKDGINELDPSKLLPYNDVRRPHIIIRKFAELTSALLSIVNYNVTAGPNELSTNQTSKLPNYNVSSLSCDIFQDMPCGESLTRLLSLNMRELMLKLASTFYARKERLVFLINNGDLVNSIARESFRKINLAMNSGNINLPVGSSHDGTFPVRAINSVNNNTNILSMYCEHLRGDLAGWIDEYADESLKAYFGSMIALLRELESSADDPSVVSDRLRSNAGLIRSIISFFNSADRSRAIEAIRGDVMNSFSNFKAGNSVLQVVLSKLLQYHQKFYTLVSNHAQLKGVEGRMELINPHNFMVEMKKYKSTF